MATRVTRHQIQDLNPSQLTQQGAITKDALVAVPNPANGGLTLTWSPTSVLPRTALHGQALIYNSYTGTWIASSVNIAGTTGSIPVTATSNDINKVLTWNGFQWILAKPPGVTSLGINTDSNLTVTSTSNNPLTSTGVFTVGVSSISLSKLSKGGATSGQILTWNESTNTWAPSAATNYVAGIKAWVVFNGAGNTIAGSLPLSASGNVTGVTDNGVGDYTINFASNTFGSNRYAFCTGINKGELGKYTSSVVMVSSSATNFRVHTGFTLKSDEFVQWDASNVSIMFIN